MDRNNFRAYNALGVIYYHQKQLPKAIAEYQNAIEVNPGFADPYYNWGLVLRDLQNPREAIDKFKKAIEVDPKYAYAYNYWGLALEDQNKPEEAIDKYRKAIELDPENYYAYNYWGPEKLSRNLGKPPNSTLNMLKHMTAGAKYCECRESSMKPIKNSRRRQRSEVISRLAKRFPSFLPDSKLTIQFK